MKADSDIINSLLKAVNYELLREDESDSYFGTIESDEVENVIVGLLELLPSFVVAYDDFHINPSQKERYLFYKEFILSL